LPDASQLMRTPQRMRLYYAYLAFFLIVGSVSTFKDVSFRMHLGFLPGISSSPDHRMRPKSHAGITGCVTAVQLDSHRRRMRLNSRGHLSSDAPIYWHTWRSSSWSDAPKISRKYLLGMRLGLHRRMHLNSHAGRYIIRCVTVVQKDSCRRRTRLGSLVGVSSLLDASQLTWTLLNGCVYI
jgi:hypothetical protein